MNLSVGNNKELVRLVFAGSVDDGKSTLIGRLFYDSGNLFDDHLEEIKKNNFSNRKADWSRLTDGLKSEREQGITIDVAYKYFTTENRRFIVADVPGHEQYTRNMFTGASNADMALLLLDASRGITIQSKRHLLICSLLNTPHITIVVNKMDLVGYRQNIYNKIKDDFLKYSAKLKIKYLNFIPISAVKGDMLVNRGKNMDWYGGDTVWHCLNNSLITNKRNMIDFRLPVQGVIKLNNKRFLTGMVESGAIGSGEEIVVMPSGEKSLIDSIFVLDNNKKKAFSPQSICVSLKQELDVSRGDIIARSKNIPETGNRFEAMISWFGSQNLVRGNSYILKHTTKNTRCHIEKIVYKLDINSLHRRFVDRLKINDIARVILTTSQDIVYDRYETNKNTGSFIIIDETTNNTVGAGLILRRSMATSALNKKTRADNGAVLWFTGLSGSGKTTIANKVYNYLKTNGIAVEHLDGDNFRKNISYDLGFSEADRDKNIGRAGYVAQILSKHNIVVLASFITPSKKQRARLRKKIRNFVEIFVDASIRLCQQRDVKGLYKKVKADKIKQFTGVSQKYDRPIKPDIHLKTDKMSVQECVDEVIRYLNKIY